MASTSGAASGAGGGAPPHRPCESCNAAPAIPFCRVEWSYLCTGCGPAVHRDSWIVAMPPFPPPNPNPNPNQPVPIQFPYGVAGQDGTAAKRKRKRRSKEEMKSERVESVMRYKEKRKSRQLNKSTRSEARKDYAELRPRTGEKSTGEEPKLDEMESIAVELEAPVLAPLVDPVEEGEEQ